MDKKRLKKKIITLLILITIMSIFIIIYFNNKEVTKIINILPQKLNGFSSFSEINASYESGLVLLMHFNNDSSLGENDSFVYDFSGNGNNGTVFNATYNSSGGILGTGMYSFDGAGDFIEVSDTPFDFNVTDNFTIALWVNLRPNNWDRIVSKKAGGGLHTDKGYAIMIRDATNRIGVIFSGGTGSINNSIFLTYNNFVIGSWQHIAAVYYGNDSAELFINGVSVIYNTSISQIGDMTNNYKLRVGAANTDSSTSVNGSIDEVAVYNRALSASEIRKLYDFGAGNKIVWNCTTTQRFDNASCWSSNRVPVAGDDVVFNATGTGKVNITNKSMPQNLNSFTVDSGYNGTIYFMPLFANGSWTGNNDGSQLWNVTNNINISNGTMYIYGDYFHNRTTGVFGNITNDGHGQEWRSVSGNITIGSSTKLDGSGLGFLTKEGPGYDAAVGPGTHGGRGGGSVKNPYGNASAPTSLGSGGSLVNGGSAIKLQADKGTIIVNGEINMTGSVATAHGPAGGSIWLIAKNISGNGILNARGVDGNTRGGGGGRIRLEYLNTLEFVGTINLARGIDTADRSSDGEAGTLTFSNNTWPGNWNVNGSFGLLGGNFGEGNIINVLGNFSVLNGDNITIYGDCFYNITICYNATDDGKGVWLNASGDINIGSGTMFYGVGLGFPGSYGPGYGGTQGATHGGRGDTNANKLIYGNATAPTSLGSGGWGNMYAGSAIKLETQGNITFNGIINVSAIDGSSCYAGSGGSIWLKGDVISGNGFLMAEGGRCTAGRGGGGGRIRLEYNSNINYTGYISARGGIGSTTSPVGRAGTLTFTNNTWKGDWTVNGSFGLLGGNFGEGNIINVLGNFVLLDGSNITVYGDCYQNASATANIYCYNKTIDGRGVYINTSGNITINLGGLIEGKGTGFPQGVGPGVNTGSSYEGASYGGKGGNVGGNIYGNETQPLSLGSGGGTTAAGRFGGGAIKLETIHTILINGEINVRGGDGNGGTSEGGAYGGGSGGSIWLLANNISGAGSLIASGGAETSAIQGGGGGGGRIALTSNGTIDFSGIINNKGGSSAFITNGRNQTGSGGTVFINASTSITISGNISVVGINGTVTGSTNDWGQRINITDTLLTLSGIFNASTSINVSVAGLSNGTITTNYTSCSTLITGTFEPPRIDQNGSSGCGGVSNSCSCPGSGNWDIVGSDTCNLTTTCNLNGNNLSCNGAGQFTITSAGQVKNFRLAEIKGGCQLHCNGTLCFDYMTT